ncbi:TIGR03899 family protein [Corallincola spongiicola]|uniref:TIGR03899 family protein n=1 Tax=Corallincola spongiicola TaxID=2520508 RepID=A0ABY1WQV0_9GAMM|nr:TIGR03899 family protein [Corallincola spongiicola]TAA47096.1 TIGR03899 family protein [Corallincola spongiicola]
MSDKSGHQRTTEPPSVRALTQKSLAKLGVMTGDTLEQRTLGERTRYREQLLQQQKQKNIEQVVAIALQHSSDSDAGTVLDPDWLQHFVELAEATLNPQMQQLWGKILAEEGRSPGSFSLKALDTLRSMTIKEAHYFQRLCALRASWGSGGRRILLGWIDHQHWWQVIKGEVAKTVSLGAHGISYSAQLALADIGLLYPTELESGELSAEPLALNINGQRFIITPKRNGLKLVYLRFSPVGDELSQLLPENGRQSYLDALHKLLSEAFEIK